MSVAESNFRMEQHHTFGTLDAVLAHLDEWGARGVMVHREDFEAWKNTQELLLDALDKLLSSHGALTVYVYPFSKQKVERPDELDVMDLRSDVIDLMRKLRLGYVGSGSQPTNWKKWAEHIKDNK